VVLELRCGSSDLAPHPVPEPDRRSQSAAYWSRWLASLSLPAVEPDAVGRSALTLRALCHVGTGAILAAATTSLPEQLGGIRNWDYRHCWLRDAALTAQALVSLGSTAEAEAYLDWVRDVLAGLPGPERPASGLRARWRFVWLRSGHRHPARLRGIAARPGRQPRRPAGPAGCVRSRR